MNTIQKRKNGEHGLADPWRDFFDVENFFPGFHRHSSLPAVNLSEEDKHYNVEVVAPGFKKEDFKVNVADDVLTISAETKKETPQDKGNKQYSRREYSYSSFTRSFRLPDNVKDDAITATYTDGILELKLPKTQQQVTASKEIKIN